MGTSQTKGGDMSRGVMVGLKALVLLLSAGVVFLLAWGMPWASGQMAETFPEFADLRMPLLLAAEVVLACAVVLLACLWQLLSQVRAGRVFDPSSLRWVNGMIGASAVAGVALLATEFWIPGPPLLGLGMLVAALVCLGLALVLVVMRGLLVQATSFRVELDQVI